MVTQVENSWAQVTWVIEAGEDDEQMTGRRPTILAVLADGRSLERLRSGEWVILRDYRERRFGIRPSTITESTSVDGSANDVLGVAVSMLCPLGIA
ncbi:MAG: hypothetical protein EA424_07705 [Planctomycetaceae bacterium]|nr:MAG: hypothetical protein EA424_07705 [Planctomycetaceae bacterium]